jgi:antirestriction protein ArdC
MTATTERKNAYARVNEMIKERMQQGVAPWKQTWSSFGPARNYMSKKAYRGINALILNNTPHEYPLFLTFRQVKEMGGYVRRGSKSIEVIYWKTLQYENEEKVTRIPFLRFYNVFNIDCVDGIRLKLPTSYVNDPIETCESVINDMPLRPVIRHGGDEPSYDILHDMIRIPARENFILSDEYYSTLFHELAHATGHSSRLDREGCRSSHAFGSILYCKEELVAEMTSCFLCGECGIVNKTIDNSSAYISWWVDRLKRLTSEDERCLVRASVLAQKAVDYILRRDSSQI